MAEKKETLPMTNVADFFSSKTVFQVRVDEENGKLLFVWYDKNDPSRRGIVVPTFEELEAIREAIRLWREQKCWKDPSEFNAFWNYLTQERGFLVHSYERDGKEVTKKFGFVVLEAGKAGRNFNNLGFALRISVDRKEEANFFFPFSSLHLFQLEYVIAKYKRLVNEAELRRRTENLIKHLKKKAEKTTKKAVLADEVAIPWDTEEVYEKKLKKTQPEATFDAEPNKSEKRVTVERKETGEEKKEQWKKQYQGKSYENEGKKKKFFFKNKA